MNATKEPLLEADEPKPETLVEDGPRETLRTSLVRQFVLMPIFVVVVFAVVVGSIFLLFGLFGSESRTPREYLNEVKTSSGSARWQAAINLVAELEKKQGSPEAKELQPEIVALLDHFAGSDDENVRLRYYLVQALGWIGDAASLDAIARAAHDPDLNVRKGALMSALKVADREALPLLVEALKDPEPEIRAQAAWELGHLKAEPSFGPLEVALNDPKEDVKFQVAWALAACGRDAAIPQLLRGLDRNVMLVVYDGDGEKVRAAMIQSIDGLARLHAVAAAERLRTISTQDPDLKVEDAAIGALQKLEK
jgi:HEAT repeat protein